MNFLVCLLSSRNLELHSNLPILTLNLKKVSSFTKHLRLLWIDRFHTFQLSKKNKMSSLVSKFPVNKILQFVNREVLSRPQSLNLPFSVAKAFEKFNLLKVKSKTESQYNIAIATLKDDQRVFQFIEKSYFCDEPLAKSLKLCYKRIESPFQLYLREILSQGKSLIAVDLDDELIGLCLSQRYCHWHPRSLDGLANISNIDLRKLLKIWSILCHESDRRLRKGNLLASSQEDVFDMRIVWAKHESVLADLMGKSIDLARDLNYSTARIDCTNVHVSTIAESLDMEQVFELPYDSILIDDGSSRRAITKPSQLDTHASSYQLNLKKSKKDEKSEMENVDESDNKV